MGVDITDNAIYGGFVKMREYKDIKGKLWELVREYEVSNSDIYRTNVQGMIEALFWVLNEDIENDLLIKIENII